MGSIGHDDSLALENHCGFLLGENDMPVVLILFDDAVIFHSCHQDFSIVQQLHGGYFVKRMENLFAKCFIDVEKQVIANVVHHLAN